MRRGGYTIRVEPGKPNWERDTFTCFHCNAVVVVKPMCDPAEMGDLCHSCNRYICRNCAGKGCMPFLKKIDAEEKKAAAVKGWF